MARTSVMVAIIGALLVGCSAGHEFGADQIVVSDPQGFVRDAQALIQKQAPSTEGDHTLIDDGHIPPRLRGIQDVDASRRGFMVASVREVTVASDHLDVVLRRHPDGYGGARVWAAGSGPHRDTRTRYEDIYFFLYDKERPVDQENIP